MGGKKRRRRAERPSIHPRNKYSENPPDFALLASLYPSFKPFVFLNRAGGSTIDWTDFNATRELTRVLLLHDHGLTWWIPDGQLCPTVPNRSNYIHWIEDLLASEVIPQISIDGNKVRAIDIGTGANCIYPLLGASLLGWSFVGTDVTDVALEWAERNVSSNPHISELIEIRKVECDGSTPSGEGLHNGESSNVKGEKDVSGTSARGTEVLPPTSIHADLGSTKSYYGPPVLLGVLKDGEKLDFCMCNPPFFETMEEAGLNPKTSCGGTPKEMVCPGGERAFITRMIEDSVVLKQSIRWYTSMVGKKSNLKILVSKLRDVGVTIVKTTEFVQGQTCRWGIAWSFVSPARKIILPHVAEKNNQSFMLEGLQRQFSAINVLQSVESFFSTLGASCKSNASSFAVDVSISKDQCNAILRTGVQGYDENNCQYMPEICNGSSCFPPSFEELCFRILVFQQIPGTLLVKGSLKDRESPGSGVFLSIFQQLEEVLKNKFCREKAF